MQETIGLKYKRVQICVIILLLNIIAFTAFTAMLKLVRIIYLVDVVANVVPSLKVWDPFNIHICHETLGH
jgi:hypothetical protein